MLWDVQKKMTNELLCQICGTYLSIGCQCNSSKKELCELCNQEFDDSDTLEKHMLNYHKWQLNQKVNVAYKMK